MNLGIGGSYPIIYMHVLDASRSSDPVTIAAAESFNWAFSLSMELGAVVFLCVALASIMARS